MFYMADVKKMLQHVIETCHGYAEQIEAYLQGAPGTIFELIAYNDEATGGNVLQQESWKKSSLWYFCLKELGCRFCEQVWHPLSLVQHNSFDNAQGNFSGIVRVILRHLLDQDLPIGFAVQLPKGKTIMKCQVR